MIREAIEKAVQKKNLTRYEATEVMNEIMSGAATDAQIASFLTALRMKGETVEEITGFAEAMREKAVMVKTNQQFLIDTCGTGGDETGTFNISTAAAFVVAGAGIHVAKHGNRSVSSSCGSADVLEALGVRLDLPPQAVGQAIDEIGIGFLFAPLLHQAMKHVMPARKETGIRTVFNVLGPLTNPARATSQVVGVYDPSLTWVLAEVLGNLGIHHALVVHGADGLDELSNTGESTIAEYKDGDVKDYTVKPEDFGMRRARLYELKGGSPEENARMLKDILTGKNGPRRDIVLLNAGAAILAADRVKTLEEGVIMAAESVDSGRAFEKLESLVKFGSRAKEKIT